MALPWHEDLTIAVKDHSFIAPEFSHPTTKAGVPHLEASEELLENMLTFRIHLDDVTDENGPLKVIPGSHRTGKKLLLGEAAPQTIYAAKGDVLAVRPLTAHASANAQLNTAMHRRILHLEFAACPEPAKGMFWHEFYPLRKGEVIDVPTGTSVVSEQCVDFQGMMLNPPNAWRWT